MNSVLVTGPGKLAVTLGELKAAARVENELEDGLLYNWLIAAIDQAQALTSRQLINATWRTYFDCFPSEANDYGEYALELEWSPVVSITAVKYVDPNGALQTLDPASYRLDAIGQRGRVVLADTASWPSIASRMNAVYVDYVAGYGVEPDNVPERIRQWIILQVSTRREFREAMAERAPSPLPRDFVDGLIDRYTVPRLG